MPKIEFIEHKGRRILYLDFSDATVAEAKELIREATPIIAVQQEGSLLTLTNITGAVLTTESNEAFKEFTAHNKPYVHAGAVVGVEGFKEAVFNSVAYFTRRNLRAFDNMTDAKQWLTTQ